jgi:hypothetical protein
MRAQGTPSDSIVFTSALVPRHPGDWGSIYLNSSDTNEIRYATIEYGGGIAFEHSCEAKFEKNSVMYNLVGLSIRKAPFISRNLIAKNTSNQITCLTGGCAAAIENNTIDGHIYLYDFPSPIVTNNIITDGIYTNGNPITGYLSYNDIIGSGAPTQFDRINYNGDSCDINFNISLDPLFVDSVNGDYHLLDNSPCINAGDSTTQFDPDSTIADMGAFYYDQSNHPAAPIGLVAEYVNSNVTLNWYANVEPDISHYLIYKDDLPNAIILVDSVYHPETTYVDSAIDKVYYYRLKSVDIEGKQSGHFSEEICAPDDPIGITGYALIYGNHNHNGIKVRFNAISYSAISDSTYTDSTGLYLMNDLMPGTYDIMYSYDSCTPVETNEKIVLTDMYLDTVYLSFHLRGNLSGRLIKTLYEVIDTINVLAGDTLIIDPGAKIFFNDSLPFVIHGLLISVGTEEDTIAFTHKQSPGRWRGLQFINAHSNCRLEYCRIEYGSTPFNGDGAGIYCENTPLEINHCLISNNGTGDTYRGGGVYSDSGMNLYGCVIAANIARFGGGMYVGGRGNISNCVICGNSVNNDGGGLYLCGYDTLLNCTISNNYARVFGGGVYHVYDYPSIIKNTALYFNNTSQNPPSAQIYGSPAVTYSNIQGGWEGQGNIEGNPLFVDTASYDYHLKWGSPCIDSGDPNSPYDPDNTIADIGALFYDQRFFTIPTLFEPIDSSSINYATPNFIWSFCNGYGVTYNLQCALDSLFNDVIIDTFGLIDSVFSSVSGLADSTYYWRVEAVDTAGVESGYQDHPFSFTIDTQTPIAVSLVSPVDGVYLSDTLVAFEWVAVRERNLSYINSDGRKKILDVQERTANSKTDSLLSTLTVMGNNVKAQITLQPRFSSVRYILQIDTLLGFVTPVVVDTLDTTSTTIIHPEGFYYWRVKAYDLAGNQGSYADPDSFGVDITPPIAFGLILPSDSTVLATTRPTFVWEKSSDSLSGLKHYEVYINDTLRHTTSDTTWGVDYDLQEGYHDWYIIAYDSVNNSQQSNDTWTVIIDITPPSTVALISPVDSAYLHDSTVSFTWHEASDNLSGVNHYLVQYALDSIFTQGLVETTSVDTTITVTLSDTVYYWRVKAVDVAGNEGVFSSVWQFKVDTGIPAAPILVAPVGGIYLGDTIVAFEWSEVTDLGMFGNYSQTEHTVREGVSPNIRFSSVRYILQIDTLLGFVTPVVVDTLDTTSTTIIHPEGFYYWRVKAYDLAGNQGSYADPDSFGVDITPPAIESTSVWNDTSFIGPFEIQTKVTDNLAGIDSVILRYKRDEDLSWIPTTMTQIGSPNWYSDSIPPVADPYDTVRYYIEASDSAQPGNIATDPIGAPSGHYWFIANCTGIQETHVEPFFLKFCLKHNPAKNNAQFSLTLSTETYVTLQIYEISGRLIEKLIDGQISPGFHDILWAPHASSGVYFYIFESPWERKVGKLVMLK